MSGVRSQRDCLPTSSPLMLHLFVCMWINWEFRWTDWDAANMMVVGGYIYIYIEREPLFSTEPLKYAQI